ncbi:hypothetical protein CW751_01285 [Brumimicrobium salinarum]|uniref:Uncharacterized protein n=1 Tax=Brumimicrobium salinarum TaxID=2058658 RepID=A0A2I0R605_9FLAO|nr:hypothetical protein [Brumimicrobium salinarum]PKR81999.1 hypothetical protein CW751_01285 [Brumimicrobium salinarum]
MKKYIYISGFMLIAFALSFSFGSCRKKGDTIAKVTVRDTANVIVPNARVILYGTSTLPQPKPVERRDTTTTNSSGVAIFNYNEVYQLGQAGVAVLDIIAEKGDMYGEGIIKIEEESENEATVFIQP